MREFPKEIKKLMETGKPLSEEQLRLLIEVEAAALNLSFEEAVEKAHNNELPHNVLGADLFMLIEMYNKKENN